MPDATPAPIRVSVILLAYNQAGAARRALQALELSQPRESIEIILVDCASSDGTAALDVEFPAIQMLRLPHHLGAGRALNIGVRTARGEFVLFLSPNVEVQPDTVAQLTAALDGAASDTVAVCPVLRTPEGESVPHLYHLPDPAAVSAPLTPHIPDPNTPDPAVELATLDALLVRKQFVQAMNYFDQRYGHAWVDAELAMQIRRAGKKIRLAAGAHAVLHSGPDPLAGEPVAAADRALGAAAYAAKYGGSGAGLRWGGALKALMTGEFRLFSALLGGQKLDGTQAH